MIDENTNLAKLWKIIEKDSIITIVQMVLQKARCMLLHLAGEAVQDILKHLEIEHKMIIRRLRHN